METVPTTDLDGRVITVWHEGYHCPEAGPFPSTVKAIEVVGRARELGWLDIRSDARFDPEATWASIRKVHDARYVDAVRTGEPRAPARSQGFDWSLRLVDSVLRIWSGHVEACWLALREGRVFHPVSGAHHASRRTGGGFCTFNFLVGAPRVLLEGNEVARVLIVDLDTHQGNGTWNLSKGDPRFAHFDISGAEFGVPEMEEERWVYRLVSDPEEYFRVLSTLPVLIESFRPDLILYQAGMDCHEDDPIGGIRGMNAETLRERDRFVFEAAGTQGVPLVFNLAGGYQGEPTVELHLGTVKEALACARPEAQRNGSASSAESR
jgi:acetoin utilization deacetylase AcuC-like enzyme